MEQRTFARRRAHGPWRDRTRRREQRAGNRYENDPVLRRGIPVGAGGGQPAKDGLHERGVDGRRLARMERSGVADGKGLSRRRKLLCPSGRYFLRKSFLDVFAASLGAASCATANTLSE